MDISRGASAPRHVIEETRRLYSDLLSKPLDSRQLAKPSFKFIQEVVKSLITETRILRNIFNSSDFDTESKVWDRARKCEFVQKLIDFVANQKRPVVGCVAAKLVAGLDSTKTNELLQSLAKVAQARLSGQLGDARRPRTFTRQRPSLSSKQQESEIHDEPKQASSRESDRSVGTKEETKRVLSGGRSRAVTSKRLSVPGVLNSSAKGSKPNNDNKGPLTERKRSSVSSIDESLKVRSRLASVTVVDEAKHSSRSPTEVKDQRDSSIKDEPFSSQRKRDPTSKISSSSSSPITNHPNSQYIIVSESDIGKSIQQLRFSFDQLRSNLLGMGQFEKKLKADLLAYLGDTDVTGSSDNLIV